MNLRKAVSLAISLLLLSTVARAQGSATGDLHVIVKDPNGGMVTTATVAAREEAKGLERSTNVNAQGEYRIVALPPGNYFFFSSRRRHTRCGRDWSSDVCSSD